MFFPGILKNGFSKRSLADSHDKERGKRHVGEKEESEIGGKGGEVD